MRTILFCYTNSGIRKNFLSLISIMMMMTIILYIRFQSGGVLKSDKIGCSRNKDFFNSRSKQMPISRPPSSANSFTLFGRHDPKPQSSIGLYRSSVIRIFSACTNKTDAKRK